MTSDETPDLPPANLNAKGLFLTDLQFEGLLAFVRSQSMIGRAWVYGSRRSGRRRSKQPATSADIDVAVDLVNVPDGEINLALFTIRHVAADFSSGSIHGSD